MRTPILFIVAVSLFASCSLTNDQNSITNPIQSGNYLWSSTLAATLTWSNDSFAPISPSTLFIKDSVTYANIESYFVDSCVIDDDGTFAFKHSMIYRYDDLWGVTYESNCWASGAIESNTINIDSIAEATSPISFKKISSSTKSATIDYSVRGDSLELSFYYLRISTIGANDPRQRSIFWNYISSTASADSLNKFTSKCISDLQLNNTTLYRSFNIKMNKYDVLLVHS